MKAMPHVLVRDLPEDVHRRLVERARAEGRSLQRHLVVELTRLARTADIDQVIARIQGNQGGKVGLAQAVDDLDQLRKPE